MKGLRKAYRGERGFTLVELLVVIVILGVLAAVATLAVTRFIGQGNLESARTELHQAQTAIAAAMADTGDNTLESDGTGTAATGAIWWNGDSNVIFFGGVDAADSIMGSSFKAAYQVDTDGEIINGTLDPTVSGTTIADPWKNITWDGTTNGWIKVTT